MAIASTDQFLASGENTSGGDDGRQLCNLAEGYSFVLQSVLGVLAFSTLICEYKSFFMVVLFH